MSISIEELSMIDITNSDIGLMLMVDEYVMGAEAHGNWGAVVPVFAQQLGERVGCDPAHEAVFAALYRVLRQQYRKALRVTQQEAPSLHIPLANVLTPEQVQEATRAELDSWIIGLAEYPVFGEEAPMPEDKPTHLEELVDAPSDSETSGK